MLPLPHMAFALQTGQNHGYAYLPRCRSLKSPLLQNADALPRSGHHVLPAFARKLFCCREKIQTRYGEPVEA